MTLLIRKYLLYNATYPADREMNSRYLYRAAAAQLRMDLTDAAVNTLLETIKQYGDTENFVNNAALLAAIYQDKLQDSISSTTLYQALQARFPDETT
ncbi:hypothetical protein RZS08_40405, partial [Arthrospira platensis SPKY1]|nr:hypothetical protein [Arthrospira platensis SPKY1]